MKRAAEPELSAEHPVYKYATGLIEQDLRLIHPNLIPIIHPDLIPIVLDAAGSGNLDIIIPQTATFLVRQPFLTVFQPSHVEALLHLRLQCVWKGSAMLIEVNGNTNVFCDTFKALRTHNFSVVSYVPAGSNQQQPNQEQPATNETVPCQKQPANETVLGQEEPATNETVLGQEEPATNETVSVQDAPVRRTRVRRFLPRAAKAKSASHNAAVNQTNKTSQQDNQRPDETVPGQEQPANETVPGQEQPANETVPSQDTVKDASGTNSTMKAGAPTNGTKSLIEELFDGDPFDLNDPYADLGFRQTFNVPNHPFINFQPWNAGAFHPFPRPNPFNMNAGNPFFTSGPWIPYPNRGFNNGFYPF